MIGPGGDGPNLNRLIEETRNLASENAKFCDLNSKLSDEVKQLRKTEGQLNAKIDAQKAKISQQKEETTTAYEQTKKIKHSEREIARKLRELTENYEVERQRSKILELKTAEQIEMRKEYEDRLQIQRSEIHQLRNENIDFLKQKENILRQNSDLKQSLESLKNNHHINTKELEQAKFQKEDFQHQLNITKNELSVTSERLMSTADESRLYRDNQEKIMDEIDNLRSRLKDTELDKNEYEAEMNVLKGKLRASQEGLSEMSEKVDRLSHKNQELNLLVGDKSDALSKLQGMVETERIARNEAQVQSTSLSDTVRELKDKLHDIEEENVNIRRQTSLELNEIKNKNKEKQENMMNELHEFSDTKTRFEEELREASELIANKENIIMDQFKKIEELVIIDGRKEIELDCLREKNQVFHKSIVSLENSLIAHKSEQNHLNGIIGELSSANSTLTEQSEKESDRAELCERSLEDYKYKLGKLTKTNRETENALSDLTADQARILTANSQMKRNHQLTINQLNDDHQDEQHQLCQDNQAITHELETIKSEWEKRARTAEKNLVQLVKEMDVSGAIIKKLKHKMETSEQKQQGDELRTLQRVKCQQDDLIFQKNLLHQQVVQLNMSKAILCELVVMKQEINDLKPGILRFRKVVIVVLASSRLQKMNYANDEEFGNHSMSLCRRLKCGLQHIQYTNNIINLWNTTWLIENIRKIVHNLSDSNWKLTNQVSSLKRKLKSSATFMNELEKRVVSVESRY